MTLEVLTGTRPFGQGYKAVPAIMEAKLPELPKSLISDPQYSPLAKEIYQIVRRCMKKEPEDRLTADEVVQACEALCYSVSAREFGTISIVNFGRHGFIRNEDPSKSDVFFHVDSVYGAATISVGQRVWFSRYPGAPRDRAFPVVPAISEKSF